MYEYIYLSICHISNIIIGLKAFVTDRQTDIQTDIVVHRKVTLPKRGMGIGFRALGLFSISSQVFFTASLSKYCLLKTSNSLFLLFINLIPELLVLPAVDEDVGGGVEDQQQVGQQGQHLTPTIIIVEELV